VSRKNLKQFLAKQRPRKLNMPPFAGWVAQLVEQRTENPCVGGSIPPPATIFLIWFASFIGGFELFGFVDSAVPVLEFLSRP
jgi:hypothetical protein